MVGQLVYDGSVAVRHCKWGETFIGFDIRPGTVGEQYVDAFTALEPGGKVQCRPASCRTDVGVGTVEQ